MPSGVTGSPSDCHPSTETPRGRTRARKTEALASVLIYAVRLVPTCSQTA